MRNALIMVKRSWYAHAEELFYLSATTFWGYMTVAFYIPMLLRVQ